MRDDAAPVPAAIAPERGLRAAASLSSGNAVRGHVFDPAAPNTRFVVELMADGLPIGLARADVYIHDLQTAGLGDGCFGFVFVFAQSLFANAAVLDVRLANTGEPVGVPIRLDRLPPAAPPEPAASVRWLGGLRFSGALARGDREGKTRVKALVDGEVVAETGATGWTHVDHGNAWYVTPSFTLDLPERFADGRVRQVDLVASDGGTVDGSPCLVIAFPDGLAAFIGGHAELESETLRARFIDRLLPQSLPMAQFPEWAARFPMGTPDDRARGIVATVLIGHADVERSHDSLDAQVGCDWVAASLSDGGAPGTFDPRDLGRFLEADAGVCSTIVFALAGTRLAAGALASLDDALFRFPRAMSAYADVAATVGRQPWPIFFSAFDCERCLEQGYCAYFFAMRREIVLRALAEGADSLFRLFNAQLDRAPGEEELPVHVPGVLAQLPALAHQDLSPALIRAADTHLRAKGMPARLTAGRGKLLPAVRIARLRPRGRVSIIIPTRNRLDLLEPCLDSLRDTLADIDREVIVVDNGSSDPELLAYLDRVAGPDVRVLPAKGHFNYAALNNEAAALASGDFLLFLNNDVEARESGWLNEMLGRSAEPDVGAVGALLSWPSGVVQHGGIALGPDFAAVEAFQDRIEGDPGYADLLDVAHECSAVTAACLLTRRRVFRAHGGFDAVRFPINFNDVDYCLKLRANRYRVVFTPFARLVHREASSRGRDARPDAKARAARELANLRNRWGDVLGADPFYSPLLSLDGLPYSGLAWPPRPMPARQRHQPTATPVPPGA